MSKERLVSRTTIVISVLYVVSLMVVLSVYPQAVPAVIITHVLVAFLMFAYKYVRSDQARRDEIDLEINNIRGMVGE